MTTAIKRSATTTGRAETGTRYAPTQTLTFPRPYGPLLVDVWEAREPNGSTPLLLIHGWGGTGSYWAQTAYELAQTTNVIVPDLPGTGRSQPVKRAMNMADQVSALNDVIDLLDLHRVQIIGHSMGGAMALLLADRTDAEVERIVLTSLSFFKSRLQESVYYTVMQGFKVMMAFRPEWMMDVPGITRVMGSRYFHKLPDDEPLLRQGLRDYLELDSKTAMACARDAASKAIPEAGARADMPVLLVACREDKVMPPENVGYTAQIIPDCKVVWVDGCGHFPMVEKHNEYMAIITDFLTL